MQKRQDYMPNIKLIPHLSANNHLTIHTVPVCQTISFMSLKRTDSLKRLVVVKLQVVTVYLKFWGLL